jgi:glycosyltransferase involved in cell wall biosynthesis
MEKVLLILHQSPPAHGAAKVGDFIASSEKLKSEYDCRFITIKSSDTIGDIGKVSSKKIYLVIELFFKILYTILIFRPHKIYFTASVRGVAFYRDLLLSTTWKLYKKFTSCEVYYHYHTKGITEFVNNDRNRKLTRYFLKDVNLMLLSPLLEKDFQDVQTYKKVLFLPNGVEDNFIDDEFNDYIESKNYNKINILYLSNMIKSKGYFEVLRLSNTTKYKNYHFHFAGGWQNSEDEKEFFAYIKDNHLEDSVTFHGFVNGEQKRELFMKASLFVFPTRYENEAFPLSILEAFSYGLPVLVTDEASIPFIVDNKSGVIVSKMEELPSALENALDKFLNKETSYYCRKRYLENFSLEQFENNLVEIFR